jgi:hypothetical protein
MQLSEHRKNLKEDLLEKFKLAQHVHGEGHRGVWDEARILKIEGNTKKYKELAHIPCLKNLISQTCQDISPSWIPLIIDEVSKSK